MVDTQQREKYQIASIIRLLVTPARLTGYHLAVLALLATVLTGRTLVFLGYPLLISSLIAAPIALSTAGHLFLVGRENWMDQRNVLRLNTKEVLLAFAASILLPVLTVLLITGTATVQTIVFAPLGSFTIFWGLIWWLLAHPYADDRMYYVNDYLETGAEWASASVSMERGHSAQEGGSPYSAHYHYTRAEQQYKNIEEAETRDEYIKAAKEHRRAAKYYKRSLAGRSLQEVKSLISKADNHLRQAGTILAKRECDECGKRRDVEDVYRVTSPQGFEESIYCSSCYHTTPSHDVNVSSSTQTTTQTEQSSTASTTSSTTSSSSSRTGTTSTSKTTSTTSTDKQKSPYGTTDNVEAGRTTQSEEPAREYENGTLTVAWACDILDIEKPLDEDKISTAYRNRVKETHPDAGGSKEDFKKVKEAKDRLDKHLS